MDTQKDGLEKITPFKNGFFLDIYVTFLECRGVEESCGIHLQVRVGVEHEELPGRRFHLSPSPITGERL